MSIFDNLKKKKPTEDEVTLRIGSVPYDGWESISITRNLEAISGSFDLRVSDKWREYEQAWEIEAGAACSISIGSDLIISGYTDILDTSADAETREINIKGRDKTADLVDCSIVTKKSQLRNKNLLEIANELCAPFGIKVTSDIDVGKKFAKWDIQQGESVFENLERAAKQRGKLFIANSRGNLEIVIAGTEKSDDDLIQGENLLKINSSTDHTNRFSDYIVKGQSRGSDNASGKAAAHNKDSSKDDGIVRYRPLLIVAESSADKAQCKDRAQWEATVRAAKALRFRVTVLGWRQSSGKLWEVNKLVQCDARLAGISAELLISSVTFRKSGSGTVTEMELVRADAYKPEPIIKEKKNPGGKKAPRGFGWWKLTTGN